MTSALETAEKSFVEMMGARFTGEEPAPASASSEVTEGSREAFTEKFDDLFQTKLTAHVLRDQEFMRGVGHLIRPEYFESEAEATLVALGVEFFNKYGSVLDKASLIAQIREKKDKNIIKKEALQEVVSLVQRFYPAKGAEDSKLSDIIFSTEYAQGKVAEWARQQAVSQAILESVNLLDKGQYDKIEKKIKEAVEVGVIQESDDYDYFDKITERTEERQDKAAGKLPPQGVTTGLLQMDELLYHRGWGRRELSIIMGGAKAGKTTALLNFAKSAALAGKNVLYITLEVAAKIISERLDASISDNLMKELGKNIHDVRMRVEEVQKRAGCLKLNEFPSGTCTPNMIRKLIERYKNKGIVFDMVVVDYADIMAPNHRTNDTIENSRTVYLDLRAIAQEENVALLTATQTNREGFKSAVAKAEHVADDFNKVRTADIMISINATEEERAIGEARLYFAASRNQEGGFTVVIKQNLAKMRFIESILRVE